MYLINGKYELFVSDEDVALLIKYRWTMDKQGFIIEDLQAYEDGLPEANRAPLGHLVLHVEIAKRMDLNAVKRSQRIKHLNANLLDNRRENLEIGSWVETDVAWWSEYQQWRKSIAWLDKFM